MEKIFVFDLDNTLYPRERGLWKLVDGRIEQYVGAALNVDRDTARTLRKGFLRIFGTTLKGLMINHGVNAADYLQFVHDVDIEGILGIDGELISVLEKIPYRKYVLTNASFEYAERVLVSLGVSDQFQEILDINFMDYIAKPSIYPFRKLLSYLDVLPDDVVFFDDVEDNVRAAKTVGIVSVLVSPNGSGKDLNLVVKSVKDIPGIMESLTLDRGDGVL